MGKGKAKGFRPPRSDDPNAGMLFGSAAHLTGDTIASPVQLREEGRALPQGHLNYGDELGKGKGKGKDGATGANAIPVAPRSKDGSGAPKAVMPPSAKAGAAPAKEEPATKAEDAARMPPPAAPAVMRASAKGAPAAGKAPTQAQAAPPAAAKAPAQSPEPAAAQQEAAPAAAAAASQPTAPVGSDGLSEIQRRRAALAEISRRRAEMLERERASQASPQSGGVAESEAPSSLEVKEEVKEEEEGGADREAADGPKEEGEEAVGEEGEEDEDDEVARAAARRRRLEEEEGGGGEADVKRPRTDDDEGKPQSGAMKQGLQQWAERVNALAAEDETDEDLAQRCRDFVRKRILKAHAEGNLHSVDWSEEPLPTVESLRAADG